MKDIIKIVVDAFVTCIEIAVIGLMVGAVCIMVM